MMNKTVRRIFPDEATLRAAGMSGLWSNIPTLVWGGNRFMPGEIFDHARDFMAARAGLAEKQICYPPNQNAKRRFADDPKTTLAVAGALANFLAYCIRSRADWREITHGHKELRPSVMHWAYSMVGGTSGQSKIGARSVARNFNYVQHYLWWAGEHEFRRPYYPHNHRFTRGVQPKLNLEDFGEIPSDDQMHSWLEQIRLEMGRQGYLITWTMAETGIRPQEAVNLQARKIPPINAPLDALSGQFKSFSYFGVGMTEVSIGAEDGTKYGKVRNIWLPDRLLTALQAWKHLPAQRPQMMKSARLKGIAPLPTSLFVSPRTYAPFTKNYINQCLIQKAADLSGVSSAHKLRHYFASRFVLRYTERILSIKDAIKGPGSWGILDGALDEAEAQLQKQLGHSHRPTTEIYKRWAKSQLTLSGRIFS